jgi:hypothetical protein
MPPNASAGSILGDKSFGPSERVNIQQGGRSCSNLSKLRWNGIRWCELVRLEGVMPSKLSDATLGSDALHLESPEIQGSQEGEQIVFLNRSEKVRGKDQPRRQVFVNTGPLPGCHASTLCEFPLLLVRPAWLLA